MDNESGTIGESEIYEYNGKKYKCVSSKPKCLGCDLLDEETAKCLNPEEMKDCMEVNLAKSSPYHLDHFQFKEIKYYGGRNEITY